MTQLHLPSKTTGSDPGAVGQILKFRTVRNERIARVLPFGNRSEVDAIGKLKRNVFQAVNSEVNAAIEKSFIEFFREEALAANLRQGYVENFVACSFDRNEIN